ncbi:hypothetical protein NBRC116583_34710 [Arenicella sp. 4NH20-0111]|uniref:gliding motility protein GldB-related protein n=1 Tax=Arenicella sp. 4NH20-0111 TaxID=3127648 RepID=UPI00310C1F26
MTNRIAKTLSLAIIFLSLYQSPFSAQAQYSTQDAENFAAIFLKQEKMTSIALDKNYLSVGTEGIDLFTPLRIKTADNMMRAISKAEADYSKAIEICLPAAQEFQSEAEELLRKSRELLNVDFETPVYILFGANNSGGTANRKGLAIGLEVLCKFAENEAEAKNLLRWYTYHEVVHVYQAMIRSKPKPRAKNSLLRQALHEGFADLVSSFFLTDTGKAEMERSSYGKTNEKKLWKDFSAAMHDESLGDWMYTKPSSDQPRDMGYWIGKQISRHYYENSLDKARALKELLILSNPDRILKKSKYASFVHSLPSR